MGIPVTQKSEPLVYGRISCAASLRLLVLSLLILLWPLAASAAPKAERWDFWAQPAPATTEPDYQVFGEFLQRYRALNDEGVAVLDYRVVSARDQQALSAYLMQIAAIDPRGLPAPAQIAYWVNLYNSLIIQLILREGIPDSIRDIRPGLGGWLAGGPWAAPQVEVAGQRLSFNDIEHRILRPLFGDARLHFVLNCASIGCPDLPPAPLTAAQLEAQLAQAAVRFLNHPRAAQARDGQLWLSSLFDWYGDDFGPDPRARIAYINRYRTEPLPAQLPVRFHYDWSLNQAAR